MGNTTSISNLRKRLYGSELWADVMANMYFTEGGMMGEGTNQIVQVMNDLDKEKGDGKNIGLTARLTGNGIDGDAEMEGNEEAISGYSDSVLIDKKRFAVRLDGALDEQKAAYNMRADAKEKLSTRLQEFIEQNIFLKLGGITNTNLTDIAGTVVGTSATWSNTPNVVPAADEASGSGNRYLCANTGGLDALSALDLMTVDLIKRAKIKAMLANPKVQPLKIKGKNYWVMFVHPWVAYDLKNDPKYDAYAKDAEARGKDNPIFTGALLVIDGVIVKEHEYAPFLDVSTLSTDNWASGGTTAAPIDAFRSILCGKQAGAMMKAKYKNSWVEKEFDYDDKVGFCTGILGGIDKIFFNSKDYGVITVDTAATDLS